MAAVFTFDEVTHVYRDDRGVRVPSVTQRLKAAGLISFAGVNPQVLERKRQLGTLVHKVTELYDQGEDLNDYEIPEDVYPYLDGWINFRNDSGFSPRLIEHQTIAELHGMVYGMRLDCTGQINGLEHILEKKCGAAEHPAWGVQLAAYASGVGSPRIARAAVQMGPQFARNYKLHPYEDRTDYQTWACVLALTVWQQNKGLFIFEDVPERLEAV